MNQNNDLNREVEIQIAQELEDGLTGPVDYPFSEKDNHKKQFEIWLFKKYDTN